MTATATLIPTQTPTPTVTNIPTLTPTPTALPKFTPTSLPPLPELYVDGAHIRRSDTGEIVHLKGAQIHNPIHDTTQEPLANSFEYIDILKLWGANLIGIPFYTDAVATHMGEIKQIVEEAERNRMYVIFLPASLHGPFLDIPLPDEQVISTIGQLAEELEPYNNVILDVWEEAPDVSWSQLYPLIERAIQTIRSVNSDVIIGIPGTQWSRDFLY